MTNLLEPAISTDDADRAAARYRKRRRGKLLLSQNLAEGSRAAREDHR